MAGVRRLEHACLNVPDRTAAAKFYTEVLGLAELECKDDRIYFGCGFDDNYDIAITEGGTGVEHFGIRVPSVETIETYERRLQQADIAVTRTDGDEPGQRHGLQFELPSGLTMELIVVNEVGYQHYAKPVDDRRRSVAPVDLDHINVMSLDVERDVEFLTEHLDASVSDVRHSGTGIWIQVFTRFGSYHHDIAFTASDTTEYSLHHLAWTMKSIDHIKDIADVLSQNGVDLELGAISRHQAGGNIFTYAWSPSGNRHEFCTEMATINETTPTVTRDATAESSSLSSWGDVSPPATFYERGS